MTYWTTVWAIVVGLAIWNMIELAVDLLTDQYYAWRAERFIRNIDWSDFDTPITPTKRKKATPKKK